MNFSISFILTFTIGKITTESWSYLNEVLIEHKEKETRPSEWKLAKCGTENISIGMINPAYIEINEIQDRNDEYKKIKKFLNKYVEKYVEKNGISIEDISIEFINYGKTELVYVLSERNGKR